MYVNDLMVKHSMYDKMRNYLHEVSRVRPGYEHTLDYKFYIDRARVLANLHRIFQNIYLDGIQSDIVKVCDWPNVMACKVQSVTQPVFKCFTSLEKIQSEKSCYCTK
jgi:hypothetical protein